MMCKLISEDKGDELNGEMESLDVGWLCDVVVFRKG